MRVLLHPSLPSLFQRHRRRRRRRKFPLRRVARRRLQSRRLRVWRRDGDRLGGIFVQRRPRRPAVHALEVRVREHALPAQTLARVHRERAPHEPQRVVVQLGRVPPPQVFHTPVAIGRRSGKRGCATETIVPSRGLLGDVVPHGFAHDVQLIHVGLTGEQRLPVGELSHDAPHGPLVHLQAVRSRTQEQLRRPVPPRGYVIRERFVSLAALELAGEAEVAQLERVRSGVVGTHE
mmetsp:Transcript_11133/g.50415  ORF Transcript_11133/g.50415 Transcript_11133/m.50415 type:complete len:234 (-) Transcript_11133:518-1219(-)